LTVLEAVSQENADLVVAPDSRLDQLGLLPVCAAECYLLWENLQPEGAPVESLATLLDKWLAQTFNLPPEPAIVPKVAFSPTAQAVQLHLRSAFGVKPIVAVKLDHGGNPAKALPRAAEVHILTTLRERGWRILLDRGFGSDELANSDSLLQEAGWTAYDIDDSTKNLGFSIESLQSGQLADQNLIRFHGSIGGWAAALACCGHAISYDSVGHHLAGALGIPVTVAFTGFSDPGFPIAWQPRGHAPITVIQIPTDEKQTPAAWNALLAALPHAPSHLPKS
jgi:ADP-heptose:LPS heptosyltransferase